MDVAISDRIAALVEGQRVGGAAHGWQRDMAARFGGLAVYGDIGGALIVRPDGAVLAAGWDDESASDAGPGWRVIALAAASYRYPELAGLAPERTPTARPCWTCGGPGCDYCFGMGWLPDSLG